MAYIVNGHSIGTAYGIMAACCNISILLVTTFLVWIKKLCGNEIDDGNLKICVFLFALSLLALIGAFCTNYIDNRDHNGHLN
jgi:hypothetical protein